MASRTELEWLAADHQMKAERALAEHHWHADKAKDYERQATDANANTEALQAILDGPAVMNGLPRKPRARRS